MEEHGLRFYRQLLDYIEYCEKLNARSIRLIEKLAEPGISYTDPFYDVRGLDVVERIFARWFSVFQYPKVKVHDYAWGRDGHTAYVRWAFTGRRRGRDIAINGVSEIMFSIDGKVASQVNYWDTGAAFYERVPVFGGLVRWVKGKMRGSV